MARVRDGDFWTERLLNADERRKTWRVIAARARHQFVGVGSGSGQVDDIDFSGQVQYNKMYAAEQNLIAMLRPDRIRVRLVPSQPNFAEAARLQQALLNYNIREMDLVDVASEVLMHTRLDGVGILKTEWGGHWTPRTAPGEAGQDEALIAVGKNGKPGRRGADIMTAMRQVFPDERLGRSLAMAWAIDGYDFLKDEATPTLRNSLWAGHRAWLTRFQIQELMRATYFEETRINYSSSTLPSTTERWNDALTVPQNFRQRTLGPNPTIEDPEEQLIEVWEVHDREMQQIVHVIPGTSELLREQAVEIEAEGLPYSDLRFGAVPWEFWSLPDNHKYIQAQETLDEVMTSLTDHAARFGKATLIVRKGMSDDDKRELAAASGGRIIEVDDPNQVRPLDYGPLPASLVEIAPALMGLITEISGVTQPGTGVPTPARTTATEITQIAQQFSSRMRRMQLDQQRFLQRIIRRIAQLQQQFFTEADAVPLLERDAIEWGQLHTGRIDRESIQGEFSFEVTVGAGAEEADLMQKKQALDFYNLFVNNPLISGAALVEMVIRKFGESPEALLEQQTATRGAPPAGPPASPDMQTRGGGMPEAQAELTDMLRP